MKLLKVPPLVTSPTLKWCLLINGLIIYSNTLEGLLQYMVICSKRVLLFFVIGHFVGFAQIADLATSSTAEHLSS